MVLWMFEPTVGECFVWLGAEHSAKRLINITMRIRTNYVHPLAAELLWGVCQVFSLDCAREVVSDKEGYDEQQVLLIFQDDFCASRNCGRICTGLCFLHC